MAIEEKTSPNLKAAIQKVLQLAKDNPKAAAALIKQIMREPG